MTNKRCILVFSGYNFRAVIAFLRVATHYNARILIVASSTDDPIFNTSYADLVAATRKTNEISPESIFPLVSSIQRSIGEINFWVLPSSEFLNRKILERRDEFRSIGVEIPLVDNNLYSSISDKFSFRSMCAERGIPIPKLKNQDKLLDPPFVVKPERYFTESNEVQFKPLIVKTHEQWDQFRSSVGNDSWYIEEFIEGRSFYLLFHFGPDNRVTAFSQENFVQQKNGGSIIAAVGCDFHRTATSREFINLFKSCDFFGLVMVEVRVNAIGSYMIEANPRLWGPSQLFVDSGIPIFDEFLRRLGYEPATPLTFETRENTNYFWSGGLGHKGLDDPTLEYFGITREEFKSRILEFDANDILDRPDTRLVTTNE